MENRTLTEKENALRAILRTDDPEWVPILDDCIDVVIPGPMMEYAPFGTSGKDWFGCDWLWDEFSFSHGPNLRVPPVLEDICEWRDVVQFPDLDSIDWEAAAKKDLERCDREHKLVRLFCTIGPFERAGILLGMENAFVAMVEEPEEYKALIDAIGDYKVKLMHKMIAAYQPDEVFFHDDLGGATGPMISLDMYRKFIKPAHKRIADVIRSYGVIYTYHSCGNMEQFIDDIIENGAQMINPLQPVNNWEEIVKKCAGKVSFDVGAEFRANYLETTKEEVIEDCRKVIDTFGPTKSLLLECFISNAACAHNKEIMNEEARRYGREIYAHE
ncbi:MAG: hypothetical protein HFG80_11565 [Eubacterium sp.]|jgi:Uroporphyrinogen-III decarboxylase|nr:hypothetical protein [Eubacterium sp.]